MTDFDYEILTDREVLHRADRQGVVVTRVQTIRIGVTYHEAQYWTDWQTGKLVTVTSRPIPKP